MRNRINDKTYRVVEYLEMGIAILVAISIGFAFIHLIMELYESIVKDSKIDAMTHFIEQALTVAVGIEFAKLLCKHRASTVVEVLIFAVARHMMGEHTTVIENLVCIISIAILFGVRKYMFDKYDRVEKTVFFPSTKVSKVNQICAVHIPYDGDDDSILKTFMENYEEPVNTITKGTCVFFHGVAIRVSKYRHNQILEFEIIRSLNSDVAHYDL